MSTSVRRGRPIYTSGRKIPDNRVAAVRRTVDAFKELQEQGRLPQQISAPLTGDRELDADVATGLRLLGLPLQTEG